MFPPEGELPEHEKDSSTADQAETGDAGDAGHAGDAGDGGDSAPIYPTEPTPALELEVGADEAEDWKDELRNRFEAWLDDLDEIPAFDSAEEDPDTPDLYSFFAEWAAANAENRKGNRRTAEAFSQWGDTLGRFEGDLKLLRQQLQRLSAETPTAGMSRSHCLILVEFLDRLGRVADAFASPPSAAWWRATGNWRQAWERQRQAVAIMLDHFESLLKKEGLARIETVGQEFDPAIMTAVAVEPDAARPERSVIEELAPGYRLRGELLRAAQVKVSTKGH